MPGTLPLDTIATHFRGFLRTTLARWGAPPADLDDLSQEVLLVLHRRGIALADEPSARAWLAQASRRMAANARRAQRRYDQRIQGAMLPAELPLPDVEVTRRQAREVLQGFLEELPAERREVFELSEFHGLSAPDIARETGQNLNTTYAWIRRLRQQWALRAAVLLVLVLAALLGVLAPTCTVSASTAGSLARSNAPGARTEAAHDRSIPVLVAAGLGR